MENILEVRDLKKCFGKRKIIDGIDLTIQEGDIYGFLGKNGSGKTTTIKMLLNLIHASSGSIKLMGYDVKEDYENAIESVGVVVDIPKFYPYLSGRKNLQLMANLIPDIAKTEVDNVLELVGMSKRGSDKVFTYSLGMKQRLGIANALLSSPKLIILDEPTNGLDPQGMREIRNIISDLAEKKKITFFISTHLLYEVEQICNKVAILHDGKIIAEGKVWELLSSELESIEVVTKDILKCQQLLSEINFIKSFSSTKNSIFIEMEKGNSGKLNALLVLAGINIEYLLPHSKSLETFFIEMTKEENDVN